MATKSMPPQVVATAEEILPKFGLAYLVDDNRRSWAVTRHTQGPGLDALRPGSRIRLTLNHHEAFSIVSRYDLMP